MSAQEERFPWVALPWALIWVGFLLFVLGMRGLFGLDPFHYLVEDSWLMALVTMLVVAIITIPSMGCTSASMLVMICPAWLIGRHADPASATASDILWSSGSLFAATTLLLGSVLASRKSLFHPRGLFVAACNFGAAVACTLIVTTHLDLIIAPAGAGIFVIGVMLALLLRMRANAQDCESGR